MSSRGFPPIPPPGGISPQRHCRLSARVWTTGTSSFLSRCVRDWMSFTSACSFAPQQASCSVMRRAAVGRWSNRSWPTFAPPTPCPDSSSRAHVRRHPTRRVYDHTRDRLLWCRGRARAADGASLAGASARQPGAVAGRHHPRPGGPWSTADPCDLVLFWHRHAAPAGGLDGGLPPARAARQSRAHSALRADSWNINLFLRDRLVGRLMPRWL